MAWRCSASSNIGLLNNMRSEGIIKSVVVYNAMKEIDRAHYTPHNPYDDAPQSIGYGVTISAPHMHAVVLELLKDNIKEDSKVLDVGSGSGYLTACLAKMVGKKGKVVGLEVISELIDLAQKNVRKGNPELLDNNLIEFRLGDAWKGSGNKDETFDAIHVGAAAEYEPDELLKQLNEGGRAIIPIGPQGGDQYLMVYDLKDGKIHKYQEFGVRYVPLVRKEL